MSRRPTVASFQLSRRLIWLKPEARVIHCDEQHGVCCESVLALRQTGWKKLAFYEPIIGGEIRYLMAPAASAPGPS